MLTLTLTLLLGCRDRIERCDGLDNDGDGLIDDADPDVTGLRWHADLDGDSFGDASTEVRQCRQPGGYVADDTDCDDGDATVRPNAEERCDGIDDDCDGRVDDDDDGVTGTDTWFPDLDGDGYGDTSAPVSACAAADMIPMGNMAWDDCDDTNPDVYFGAEEVCDGVDNDCDALVDEEDDGLTGQLWYPDDDGDGYGATDGAEVLCDPPPGSVTEDGDCDDNDPALNPGAEEVCNDLDDNCNDLVDGQDPYLQDATTWYADADSDGYGDGATAATACHAPPGTVRDGTDCDDREPAANPGATEVCDDIDDDCDGLVDGRDDSLSGGGVSYADADGDGYGDPSSSTTSCGSPPAGYVTGSTDCDDTDATVHPWADEVCDGADDDCDGLVDDDDPGTPLTTWYADTDGDGYGDLRSSTEACAAPPGYVENGLDCDDSDATSGSCAYPVDCAEILALDPSSTSGTFAIDPDGDGVLIDVTCDMDTDGGGWTVLADEDYVHDTCPAPWTRVSAESICAGVLASGGAASTTWSAFGIAWSEIQVSFVAQQYESMDGFSTSSTDIESNYVDGVSVTHGASGSREHIWTYAVARDSGTGAAEECPDHGGTSPPPSFTGSDWSCATGNPASSGWYEVWYHADLFGDVEQVTLSTTTTDDVEVRILTDQSGSDEDVGIARVYIAVR